jgi:hypothetical protein
LTLSLAALVVVCAFLPWVRTGEASRSSFRLLRDLTTLGVLRSDAERAARVAWVLLPCLAAAAGLAIVLGRPRLGALLTAVVAVIGLSGAVVVANSPVSTLLGAQAMFVVAPVALVSSLLTALRTPTRTPAGTLLHPAARRS